MTCVAWNLLYMIDLALDSMGFFMINWISIYKMKAGYDSYSVSWYMDLAIYNNYRDSARNYSSIIESINISEFIQLA